LPDAQVFRSIQWDDMLKSRKEWENRFKEISIPPIYLHQPTFAGINGTINGNINNGTFTGYSERINNGTFTGHSERIISKRNLEE
ncbi:15288_t:CDS:2, partial [Racocetra persica]